MRIVLFLLLSFVLVGAPLRNQFARIEIKQALESAAKLLGQEEFFKEKIEFMEQMDGERTTYNTPMPSLFTVKDGVLLIKQTKIDSLSILRSQDQVGHDEDWFKFSSVRPYRFPFVNNKGMMFKKSKETHCSIYYLTFRKEVPAYIKATGNSKVFILGDSFAGKSFEIWLQDDAQLIVENLVQAGMVTIHVRDRAHVTIKKGSAESVYLSPRKETVSDLGGFLVENVVLNLTNGPIGTVRINPQKNYFMLGRNVHSSLECRSDIKPVTLNSKKFKTKRFFIKSLPRNAAKITKGVVLVGGYTVIFSALVASIIHGIYPALAGISLVKNALIGASALFGVGVTIRSLVKKNRPESMMKSSI